MENSHFEDQNINTINIPQIATNNSQKNINEYIESYQKNKEPELYNLDAYNSQPLNDSTKQIFYKLSMRKSDMDKEDLLSKEFDELIRQIIESKNGKFLDGEVNLIEFLILKYSKTSNTQTEDVKNIESLSLQVKEDFGMLNEFGKYLPKLIELNLSGSGIKSILDIGSTFKNLITLNISNCNVSDLSGIVKFLLLKIV